MGAVIIVNMVRNVCCSTFCHYGTFCHSGTFCHYGLLETGGRGVWRWGVGWGRGREIIYLSLHYYHQNDLCIKVGSDESHLNVS